MKLEKGCCVKIGQTYGTVVKGGAKMVKVMFDAKPGLGVTMTMPVEKLTIVR